MEHVSSAKSVADRCPSSGEVIIPLSAESRCKMYMGLRMTDLFGHINNSRYIEVMEFARWYQLANTGFYERVRRAQLVPVVSSIDVQYVREIKPCTNVVVRTRIGSISGRNMVYYQQIESIKGDTVHATALVRFAWLNGRSYVGPDGKKPRPGPVDVDEALTRAGYPSKMISDLHSSSSDNCGGQYFGNVLTQLESKLSARASSSAQRLDLVDDQFALERTFPHSSVSAVNESDEAWRRVLRQEAKVRKELLGRR